MELHPYDGIERCFRHTDTDRTTGFDIIAQLLQLQICPPYNDILYDLSFYSGGFGIFDRLAISLPANRKIWESTIVKLGAKTLEDANQDLSWTSELVWLLSDDEEDEIAVILRETAVRFINNSRCEFQSSCKMVNWIYFIDGSNINHWGTLWGDATRLNYRAYSQG